MTTMGPKPYYEHMARRQVLVQLTDELVAELDREAQERGISRSAVLRTAIDSFLQRESVAALERRLVEGYRRHPADEVDTTETVRQLIQEEPW